MMDGTGQVCSYHRLLRDGKLSPPFFAYTTPFRPRRRWWSR